MSGERTALPERSMIGRHRAGCREIGQAMRCGRALAAGAVFAKSILTAGKALLEHFMIFLLGLFR